MLPRDWLVVLLLWFVWLVLVVGCGTRNRCQADGVLAGLVECSCDCFFVLFSYAPNRMIFVLRDWLVFLSLLCPNFRVL